MPAEEIHAPIVDWSKTPLTAAYEGHYVKIIDDVFSPEECAELIALAESDAEWKEAAVHYGLGANQNYVDKEYRDSERILRFDKPVAEKLYQKLRPYVSEVAKIQPGDKWEKIMGRAEKATWECVGINERLSYLKYGIGHFFGPHCDGPLVLPDGRNAGITVQIYLGDEGVEGGATRIYGYDDRYFDVEPKKGRVLIFQQRNVYHSGEKVTKGFKYTLRSDFMFRRVDA
ncbi:hypothetical protein BDN70DRAFT_910629 [Pholiota conissans]|uniref:Prolyl 4-hydroxylase alpha subunit domain-containing protein n=1 Tax=Pholiota conissans TaxID=109636 RepID=A0A9P6D661_9AGAR|nr:hypothetical protein BDN70DRAFT_910629 [Pholiota conissans]